MNHDRFHTKNGHSTEIVLIRVNTVIMMSIFEAMPVLCVLLDLVPAFGTVEYTVLYFD